MYTELNGFFSQLSNSMDDYRSSYGLLFFLIFIEEVRLHPHRAVCFTGGQYVGPCLVEKLRQQHEQDSRYRK